MVVDLNDEYIGIILMKISDKFVTSDNISIILDNNDELNFKHQTEGGMPFDLSKDAQPLSSHTSSCVDFTTNS